MRHLILTLLTLCVSVLEFKGSDSNPNFMTTFYGGIYINNEQAWIIEPEVTWNFHKYLGMSLGMEITRQYNQPNRLTLIDGYEAELTDNERNIGWVIFKPNILVKTPNLWLNDSKDIGLLVQVSGGISIACPFRNSLTYEIKEFNGNVGSTVAYRTFKNMGLNWLYWNSRVSLKVSLDRFLLGIGYGLSNFDYYSCRRNIRMNGNTKFSVPPKLMSQSMFISMGLKF